MGTSASGAVKARIRNLVAASAALALSLALAPATSLADDDSTVGADFVSAQYEESASGATPNSILASTLTSDGVSVISADVMLGDVAVSDTVIGSFTVDGFTFTVNSDGVTLVSVAGPLVGPEGKDDARSASQTSVVIPESITYAGITYPVTAIGSYAFYLSGATQVSLPGSITSVDDRAFRSSDVESVSVDADNPTIASFDGCLYDSQLTSLLLIPEGRTGVVLLPSETEVVEPSKFSHCSLVEAIDVEEGDAAFASWDGLLYDASGTTLLRVPAGATEITIHDGCTTIAAGAMEGCAKLERINAPSTVTSISPDVFDQPVETLVLPASSLLQGELVEGDGTELPERYSSIVALTASDNDVPTVNIAAIEVMLSANANRTAWERAGLRKLDGGVSEDSLLPEEDTPEFVLPAAVVSETVKIENEEVAPVASLQSANTYGAYSSMIYRLEVNDADMGSLVTTAERVVAGSVLGARSMISMGSSPMTYSMTLNGVNYRIDRDDGCYMVGYASPSAGYEFKGWAATSTGTPQSSMNASHAASSGSGSLVLTRYAIFAKKASFSVSLDKNGGSGGTSTTYYWPGKGYTTFSTSTTVIASGSTLVSSRPTLAGYTFAGYYSSASGGTQYVDANGNLTDNAPTITSSTSTWYAHWTKNAISTVNLYQNAGNTTTKYKTIYLWYGKGWYDVADPTDSSTALTTIGTPTRAGYTYKGFATSSTATSASYWTSVTFFPGNTNSTFGSATTAKTVSVYAVWSKNAVSTVNLYKNAGDTTTLYKTIYLWYGKGWYDVADPTDSSTALTTIGTPTRAGYTYKGFATSSTATSASYWTSVTSFPDNTNSTFGSVATAKIVSVYAVWLGNSYDMLFDPHGGTGGQSGRKTMTYMEALPSISKTKPTRAGYTFDGWWLYDPDKQVYASGAKVYDASCAPALDFWAWGALSLNSDGTPKFEIHAKWIPNSYDMLFDPHGGEGGQSGRVHMTFMEELPEILKEKPTRTGYSFDGWYVYGPDKQTYQTIAYNADCEPAHDYWPWGALALNADGTPKLQIHAKWALDSYTISYELNGGEEPSPPNPTTYNVETPTITLNNPAQKGYVFSGWSGTDLSGSANKTVQIAKGSTGDRSYEAHWVPALSADVPLEVTARVDLLGIDEQTEASGYIESRSGGALEVAAIGFTPLAGATELFESNVSNVFLEALAEGTTDANVSFALSAAATETDADALAAFALPDGYGSRVGVAYRFAIPDDVLATIDQARFAEVTTPIGQVVYTVALAS